jgi:hypothetical protein
MTPDQLNNLGNATAPSMNLPQTPTPGIPAPTVNIDNELKALADIHLPDQISWWPPAPGWWAILVLSLVIIYFAIKFFNKKRHQSKYKKLANSELQTITRFWQKQQNLIATAARLSPLMRRIAIANHQRNEIASLNDQQWLLFLDQQPGLLSISKNYSEILIDLPYQDPMIKFDSEEQKQLAVKMDKLLLLTSKWIKKGFKHV